MMKKRHKDIKTTPATMPPAIAPTGTSDYSSVPLLNAMIENTPAVRCSEPELDVVLCSMEVVGVIEEVESAEELEAEVTVSSW